MPPPGHAQAVDRLSWGRTFRGSEALARPRFLHQAPALLRAAAADGMSTLGVGLGRSYGDSGLNLGQAVLATADLDRMISFDAGTGVLRAEAGASLDAILRLTTPRGWFLPTTPGTRFVSLGGAVANDVHGKNHHRAGTLGASVRRLGLWRSDRGEVEISPEAERDLFAATIGGLGLTGLILWVELQLAPIRSAYLDQETIGFGDVAEFHALARASEAGFEHVVAWVDCTARGASLGRGVLYRGNWRADGRLGPHGERAGLALPIDLPEFALNPASLKAFNILYHWRQTSRPSPCVEHYDRAFYPLDAVRGWNRLYGRRGFFQYQCLIPAAAGVEPVRELLAAISASGEGSFLAVLKLFGDHPSPGLLSFPAPGVTLALDFANRGERTHRLFARLDDIVRAAGGRLYPAKDSRMPAGLFRSGYPQWARFARMADPAFSSSFWRRMQHD